MTVNGIEDMNGELFSESLVGLGDEGGSLESSESGGNKDQECKICDNKLCNPLVLNCLHVFCESCLEKLLVNETSNLIPFSQGGVLVCPTCKQETKVPSSGVSSLPSDYILTNTLDVSSVDQSIVCTCCKSKEQAIARCSDCSHFLCPNCTSAHEHMRCFENHTVVPFEAIRSSKDMLVIHKPIFCEIHSGESLLFYCHPCEEAVCQECVARLHKTGPNHQSERLNEAESTLRRQLNNLMRLSGTRATECQRTTGRLDESLTELERQREEAQGHIRNSYQSVKTALKMARDRALEQLGQLHSERELKVMELYHNTNNTVQKLEDAYKFTSRLLKNGDGTEIALLMKVVAAQVTHLVSNTPKVDVKLSLEFETNVEKLENILVENFGKFKTEASGPNETGDSGMGIGATSPPLPLSTPLQSSFDEFALTPTSPLVPAPLPPNFTPLTSIAEYNLQQLASLQKEVSPAHPSPAPGQLILSELMVDEISSTQVFNNLHALAKLGLNSEVNGGSGISGSGVGVGPVPGRSPPMLTLPTTPSPRPGEDGSLSTPTSAPFPRSTKATPMHIRYKFGQLGGSKGQFNSPHGFCLGNEEDIIVADTNNHRITVFEKTGTYKFHFGTAGKEEGQLWYPRKVAMMRTTGKFVVCDRGNERSRMQIFTKNGHFLKKIAVRYIDIVAGLAVTSEGHIVAVDSVTPTVFVISENGDLLSWFDCSECMREPSDIAINGKEFYVCDFKGHCVVVFSEEGKFLRRIGYENITNYPNGIDVSDAGDVLIGDSHGNRFHVAVFTREGELVTEFECPYVKVSRCCGLKITSEGYIVTLAKNNHHVLVLNTLYIV